MLERDCLRGGRQCAARRHGMGKSLAFGKGRRDSFSQGRLFSLIVRRAGGLNSENKKTAIPAGSQNFSITPKLFSLSPTVQTAQLTDEEVLLVARRIPKKALGYRDPRT